MKNNNILKSFGALVLACVMVFSSVSSISANETQKTDKPSFDVAFENEVGVKYLSEEDTIAVVEAMWGKLISEMPTLTMDKYGPVHIVNENTTFSIDWNNSAYSKKDVKGVYINTFLWYRDGNGTLQYAKGYPDNGEVPTEKDYFILGYKLKFLENAKGELNFHDNFFYSMSDFEADGGNKSLINEDADFDGTLDSLAGGRLCFDSNWPCMYLINDVNKIMNSSDTTSWSKPQCIFKGENSDRRLDSFFDNNMFLSMVCVEYTNAKTGETHTSWEYIVSESAMTSANNPFTYLNEKPSDEPATEDKGDESTTDDKEDESVSEDKNDESATEDKEDESASEDKKEEPSSDVSVDESVDKNNENQETPDSNKGIIYVIIFGVIAAAAGVGGFVIYKKKK